MHERTLTFGVLVVLALFAPAAFASNIYVTNTNDSGPGSLRSTIASAASGDTIYFNPKAIRFPATITVASPLMISQNLTILGPGASLLFISGGHSIGVVQVSSGTKVGISAVTIENGMTSTYGGGIYNQGTLTLNNCIVSGNAATIDGGGINNQGTTTISSSTFSGNSALNTGGGVLNSGTMTLSNSSISGNSGGIGSAIANHGTLTLRDSKLSGNTANLEGGGIYNDSSGDLTVINSTLSGNGTSCIFPTGLGGAIYNAFGTLTLTNTTIFNSNSNIVPFVFNCGGGIFNYLGSIIVKNTIIANGRNCYVYSGSLISLGHNLSDDTTCATYFNQPGDMNSTSAGLDPAGLKDNGGPTQTIALLPASPAVDAVPVNACTDVAGNPVTTDQRGVARPQGRACDIGAFELVPFGASLPAPLQ